MSEYVLKINKGNKNINKLIKTEGYTFNPKNDIVKSFTVYDEKFLNKIILLFSNFIRRILTDGDNISSSVF